MVVFLEQFSHIDFVDTAKKVALVDLAKSHMDLPGGGAVSDRLSLSTTQGGSHGKDECDI